MKLDFSGQTVLITGGMRGIGAALADAFEEAGAKLILTGTKQSVADSLNGSCSDQRSYVAVDFLDVGSVSSFIEYIGSQALDVCVNNAGINRIGEADTQIMDDYQDVLKVNLDGPMAVCKAVIPGMKARGYGRIINISSIWSVATKAGRSAYCASKSGLVGMSRAMSVELASHNILVNCVSPGFTLTELTAQSLSQPEQEKICEGIPMQRMAEPEEMAPPILFAASRLNTYMTGQNLIVDGGFVNV